MNRSFPAIFLGVVLLLQIFFFSGFSSASAQASSNYTVQDALNNGTSIFDGAVQNYTTAAAASQNQATIEQFNKGIEFFNTIKAVYVDQFSGKNPTTPSEVAALQASAIDATMSYMQASKSSAGVDFRALAGGNIDNDLYNQSYKALQTLRAFAVDVGAGSSSTGIGNTIVQNATQGVSSAPQKNDSADPSKCEIFKFTLVGCIDAFLTYLIKTVLLSWVGIFTWMFGMLWHFSIYYGVLHFIDLAGKSDGPFLQLWTTIRDIFNLVMIFFGFALTILYILNKTDALKRFVPMLLVYALFVNFSWTMSRTLVDYSNIMTLKMYELTVPNALENTSLKMDDKKTAAGVMMEKMGMQTLVGTITAVPNSTTVDKNVFADQIKSTPVALLFVVMAAYLAYVFLVAAILFAVRTVLMLVFIVFSPILLIDIALPWVGQYAQKAREIFFAQLSIGFVFMLFLYVVTQTMEAIKGGLKISSSASAGVSADISQFFGVLIMIILLYVMMKAVKAISPMAGSVMNSAAGAGLAFATGGTAMIGRATVGAAAAKFAGSEWLDRRQGSALGRATKSASEKVGRSKMDLRDVGSDLFAKKGGKEEAKEKVADRLELRAKEVSARARGIKDDAARNKYLASQGKAANLYYIDRAKRVGKYEKATGANKQEVFYQNTDLRNEALAKDRAEADAMNKASLLGDLDKKKAAAGVGERNKERDAKGTVSGEGLDKQNLYNLSGTDAREKMLEKDRAEAMAENKAILETDAKSAKTYSNETSGEGRQELYASSSTGAKKMMVENDQIEANAENAQFDKNKASGNNWSEARNGSGPGPIEFDRQEVKSQVKALERNNAAVADLAKALRGFKNAPATAQGATEYSKGMPTAQTVHVNTAEALKKVNAELASNAEESAA